MPYQCSWHIARTIVRWHCHCSFPCRKFKLDSWIRNATGMVWCWIWLVVVIFHSLLGKLETSSPSILSVYLDQISRHFASVCCKKQNSLKLNPSWSISAGKPATVFTWFETQGVSSRIGVFSTKLEMFHVSGPTSLLFLTDTI